MLYHIPMEELSEHFHIPIDGLKQKSYQELEQMELRMKQEKAFEEAKRSAADEEYIRILKKYFTMWDLLTRYWKEEDVIAAASRHLTIRDITSECPVRAGDHAPYQEAEFIETKGAFLPRFTKSGEQLLYGEWVKCDVYRIPNQYQHTRHGNVVLDLLYQTYPELKEFQFNAYGMYAKNEGYEIYPRNKVYTPFIALMEGDIDAIVERNISYGKSYNCGKYTVAKVKERLASPEIQRYFDVIRAMDRKKIQYVYL